MAEQKPEKSSAKAAPESVRVGVRLRPFVAYEVGQKQCLTISGNVVSVSPDVECTHKARDFAFDCAMDSTSSREADFVDQSKCYKLMAERMVDHVLRGYSSCLFCYGQTGTGKTTTIMGKVEPLEEQGLLLRLMSDLFDNVARMRSEGAGVQCKVQMLEVYNEKIKDLLVPPARDFQEKKALPEVHVHPKLGVYVKGVADEPVDSFDNCVQLIEYGNTMKTVAATAMNAKSSRAHTIFKLMVEKRGSDSQVISSEAYFVDLAGRENEKTTKAAGERLVELSFINRSLMWLATCIQALADTGRKSVGARGQAEAGMMSRFRNSKLTLLLSNALNGNSKTSMIGTLSPALANFEESYSTLNFASTVKNIKVEAKPASAMDKDQLVKTLQQELRQLKEQLAGTSESTHQEALAKNMEGTQSLLERFGKNWEEAQNESKQLMQQRGEALQKLGNTRWNLMMRDREEMQKRKPSTGGTLTGVPVPHLVNYSEDPHLSGRLLFHPEEVGKEYSVGHNLMVCDFIVPHGLGINNKTCYLRQDQDGRLYLRPASSESDSESESDDDQSSSGSGSGTEDEEWNAHGHQSESMAIIEVNGARLKDSQEVELQHQDCVVLGRSIILYAFTKPGGTLQDLPHHKLPAAQRLAKQQKDSNLLIDILGKERAAQPDQLQMAQKYVDQLHGQNVDSTGAASVHEFMLLARNAASMVDEANHITEDVKPGGERGLQFQLCAISPPLAFGYTASSCPELGVRLVRHLSKSQVSRKTTLAAARRSSVNAHEAMLDQLSSGAGALPGDEESLEVLFVWTFQKFTSRLQLMQEVWDVKHENPDTFDLEKMSNPWSEQGPGEIAEMKRQYNELRDSLVTHSGWVKQQQEMMRIALGFGQENDMLMRQAVTAWKFEVRRHKKEPHGILAEDRQTDASPAMSSAASSSSLPKQQEEAASPALTAARTASSQLQELHKAFENLEAENRGLKAELEGMKMKLQQFVESGTKPRSNGSADDLNGKVPGSSPVLKGILDLSRTNLLLVLDLFDTLSRLSSAMLQASAACLQPPRQDSADPSLDAARMRLAEAATDLSSFFSSSASGLGGIVPLSPSSTPSYPSSASPRRMPTLSTQASMSTPVLAPGFSYPRMQVSTSSLSSRHRVASQSRALSTQVSPCSTSPGNLPRSPNAVTSSGTGLTGLWQPLNSMPTAPKVQPYAGPGTFG